MSIYILNNKQEKNAINLSVIGIKFYDVEIELSNYDALIFTSKNGLYAIDKIDKSWRDLEIYSIGKGTTNSAIELGVEVTYTAKTSYGNEFANEIKSLLKGKKALYLRPKVVVSRVSDITKEGGVDIDEKIIYETVCNDCSSLSTPPKNSTIIFSSPSTIECFLKCFEWDKTYRAIVIGKNTAKFMPQSIKYRLAPKQTLESCINLGNL